VGKTTYLEGIPPPLIPLKVLLDAAFAKSVCKILSGKELEVKILTTKELGPLSAHLSALPSPRR
jgi:hypothetical protein